MSLLSRIFGSKDEPTPPVSGDLEARLTKLEDEAHRAPGGHKGTPLNKAGDVALRGGDRGRALGYYGRAIDTFLEDEQREAARGVANKLIRVHPEAARTLCTLTWLDLGARHMATALLHLRDYLAAVKRVGAEQLGADQIYEMARITPQSEFLTAAADALDALDFGERADEVRQWARDGCSPDACTDEHELAAACLQAAIRSNGRVVSDS